MHIQSAMFLEQRQIAFLGPLECTEVRNGRFSSGGDILSQLKWHQSDIQKLGFPKYEIKDN